MAVSLTNLKKCVTFCRFKLLRRAVLSQSSSYASTVSNTESNAVDQGDTENESREPKVGMSADGRTLICWHPEQLHPYKHSQPIVYDNAEVREGDVPLEQRLTRQYETQWRKDGPTKEELSKITYTTKHPWFPKKQKKYRTYHVQKEREGL